MIYQQTNSQGFHIGTNAEPKPGAIDTTSPVYDPETERAKWDGTQWIVKTKAEWDAPPPEPTEAEKLEAERQAMQVKAYQAQIAMAEANVLSDVEAVIQSADRRTQIAYAKADTWKRYSPTILSMQTALVWTDTFVDDLFRAAAVVEV